MIGSTFFMEFRKSWKGFTLFLIIILLTAGGMPQFYTAFTESQETLEGEQNVRLHVEGEMIELSWKEFSDVDYYNVIEDNVSFMVTPDFVYKGKNNYTTVPLKSNETQYFAVVANINGTDDAKLVGIATTSDKKSPFDEMMDSSFYRSFTGNRDISMTDIKGFISVEFFSWWFLLAGLYIGYISVNSIGKDFEEKRMDIIFSTPTSRRRYILEKFAALSAYTLLMVLAAGGILLASIHGLGLLSDVNSTYMMLALIGSWPVLLVMEAVAILCVVFFANSRTATGLTLLFAFFQYAMQVVANISSNYSYIKDFSILGYWDYNETIFDNVFSSSNFAILIILVCVIMTAAILVFDKRDIPA